MEVSVVIDIKKRKSKTQEESSPIIDKESPIKVKDVDINKTVKDFKNLIYEKLNLSNQISRNRLGILLSYKNENKEIRIFLSDDFQQLLFYDGISNPNAIFYIKDIGPQINYRLVYVIEYLGPLIFSLLFFIRYVLVFRKNNPKKEFQTHVISYFCMAFFHFTK